MAAPTPKADGDRHALPQVETIREIADSARVHPQATIAPFCTIGPDVAIGRGTVLGQRVTVIGHTVIGCDNVIGDGSVLGALPQDLKYSGRPTYLMVGDRNRLGTNVTAHVGTEKGGYLTRIGDDNVLEAGSHVAHDCFVDDHTHLGAAALLAGHIRVETGAVVEEMVGVHHFTTIGRYSRVGARTPVRRDVPPYVYFAGMGYYTSPPAVRGPNESALPLAGLTPDDREQLRRTIDWLFQEKRALSVKVRELLARPDLPLCLRQLAESCLRSLSGHFGRSRESLRGMIPPETFAHLPAGWLDEIRQGGRK